MTKAAGEEGEQGPPGARQTLRLREGCLDAPTPFDAAVVGAMMLWPPHKDHDDIRARFVRAFTIDRALLSGNHPQPATVSEREQFFELIRSNPGLAEFDGPVIDAYRRGMIAGTLLREVIASDEAGLDNVTLETVKKRISSKFVAERISVSTINNTIWKRYRSVAVYWAAHISMSSATGPFPCRVPDLGRSLPTPKSGQRRLRPRVGRTRNLYFAWEKR